MCLTINKFRVNQMCDCSGNSYLPGTSIKPENLIRKEHHDIITFMLHSELFSEKNSNLSDKTFILFEHKYTWYLVEICKS